MTVVAGMYVGATCFVGVTGGVTRGAVGDTGGVWVMGETTLTGLCILGRTRGGGALTVSEEGSAELDF